MRRLRYGSEPLHPMAAHGHGFGTTHHVAMLNPGPAGLALRAAVDDVGALIDHIRHELRCGQAHIIGECAVLTQPSAQSVTHRPYLVRSMFELNDQVSVPALAVVAHHL